MNELQDRLAKQLTSELTKSTARLFETAIKNEVQRSVLPALEAITKTEVRNALNSQIVKGLGDSMKQVSRVFLRL